MQTIDTAGFETIKAVVAIFEQLQHREPHLLYGPKLTGFGQGFLMSPGGKYEPSDENNPVTAAHREGYEEANLEGWSNIVAGQVTITIRDERVILPIDIVIFTSWSGQLRWSDEFEWLRFIPLNEILSSKILPRDEEWLRRILVDQKPTSTSILCGKNRADVLDFEMVDFKPKK